MKRLRSGTLEGRQAPLAHGAGPGLEPLDHGVEIEFLRDG